MGQNYSSNGMRRMGGVFKRLSDGRGGNVPGGLWDASWEGCIRGEGWDVFFFSFLPTFRLFFKLSVEASSLIKIQLESTVIVASIINRQKSTMAVIFTRNDALDIKTPPCGWHSALGGRIRLALGSDGRLRGLLCTCLVYTSLTTPPPTSTARLLRPEPQAAPWRKDLSPPLHRRPPRRHHHLLRPRRWGRLPREEGGGGPASRLSALLLPPPRLLLLLSRWMVLY